jgi:hypothetical protein
MRGGNFDNEVKKSSSTNTYLVLYLAQNRSEFYRYKLGYYGFPTLTLEFTSESDTDTTTATNKEQ